MKVLMTSILCRSGLMTHVHDLIQFCRRNSVMAAAAFQKTDFVTREQAEALKQHLGDIPIWEYERESELADIAAQAECDLIHAHSYLTFNAARAAAEQTGVPLILTLHSVYPWAAFFWDALSRAERIIAVGPAQARYTGPWRRKTVIIPNGVDITRFCPKQGRAGKEIKLLWYGRVNGRLSRGLAALDELAPQLPAFIKIEGLGEADIKLKNIVLKEWTEDPVSTLQESHITFAHGRSLREAMACGSAGMLIGHGYGGTITRQRLAQLNYVVDAFPQYHLPRPRPEEILRDILELIESGSLEAIRAEARHIAEEHFSLELMGRRTLEVYAAAA